MRKLKIGDEVKVFDTSYVFGVYDGSYSTYCHYSKVGCLTILRIGLNTRRDVELESNYDSVCDIFVTDGITGFWFAKSNQVELVTHTISVDGGKEVELSNESYENLRKQLL